MIIKNKKYIILGLSILVLLPTTFVYAAESPNIIFNTNFPAIPAPVPGGFFDLNCIEGLNSNLCSSDFEYAPTIGNIILFIFTAAIWIGGLVAFGVLFYGGFLYIFSGNAPANRSKARGMLVNVAWGIGILLLSVVFLNLINPDVANLRFENPEAIQTCPDGTTDCITYPELPKQYNTFGCSWNEQEDKCEIAQDTVACTLGFKTSGVCEKVNGLHNQNSLLDNEKVCKSLKSNACALSSEGEDAVCNVGSYVACLGTCLSQGKLEATCQNECSVYTGGGSGYSCRERCQETLPPQLAHECSELPSCLETPPGVTPAADGYFKLPASNFYTKRYEDASCGKLELIQAIYVVAKRWSEIGGSKMNVTDLNGGGDYNSGVCHSTHNRGIDVDIHIEGVTLHKTANSGEWLIKLGKLLVDTGVVSGFIHRTDAPQDAAALEVVNRYFENKFPNRNPWHPPWALNEGFWRTDTAGNHEDHMHIHIGDSDGATGTGIQPGPYNRSCSRDTTLRYYSSSDYCCYRTDGGQQKCG